MVINTCNDPYEGVNVGVNVVIDSCNDPITSEGVNVVINS